MQIPQPVDVVSRWLLDSWRERAVLLKAVSFALVGVINTLVDATVFFLAYLHVTSSLVTANVISWSVAITGSYILNSFITFAAESGRKLTVRAYGAFVVSGILGFLANTTALVTAAQVMPVWAAKICAILVSFVVNFSIMNFVVFRPRPQVSEP